MGRNRVINLILQKSLSLTMRYSQFILFSPMRRPAQALLALLRFDPSERFRLLRESSNVKSARCYHKKLQRGPLPLPLVHTQTQTQTQAYSSWTAYAIPGGVMGFAGLAAFVHYNDEIESRAIPKGASEMKLLHSYLMNPKMEVARRLGTEYNTQNQVPFKSSPI